MKLNKKEIITLYGGLNSVENLKGRNVKFAYNVSKNLILLENEVKPIQETIKEKEDFAEYEKARVNLCIESSVKDENDIPIIENNEYVITNKKKFNKDLENLQIKHKEAIEEREKQISEYRKLIEDETKEEINLKEIEFDDLPDDISPHQLKNIMVLIKE